jgi:hypothetical protein
MISVGSFSSPETQKVFAMHSYGDSDAKEAPTA